MQDALEHVDILIVGSGPVGAACARLLVEGGRQVLLIDAGPQLTERPGLHVRNIADAEQRSQAQISAQGPTPFPYPVPDMPARARATATGDYRLEHLVRPGTHLPNHGRSWGELPAAACSTNVGGMGAHWTCACPRPADDEVIDFIPRAEMNQAFDEAERLLAVSTEAYPDTPVSSRLRQRLAQTFGDTVQRMPLACSNTSGERHWSGADTVLGPLAEHAHADFELRHSTLCQQLIVDNQRIVGAQLTDLNTGHRYRIDARWVIVAADALRTPQVLWASGIRPEALGRYLNDQPQVVHAVRLDSDAAGVLVPGEEPTVGVYRVPYDQAHHPFHGQVMQMEACPIQLAGDAKVEHIVAMGWFCCKQDIRAEDRVRFSETETDHFGLPALTLDYQLTTRDRAQVERAASLLKAAGKRLGQPLGEDPLMLPPGSSLHYQGTTRMGTTDDGRSVCDSHGQVWGYANLFVAGNGVIPTPTACNPTLTSVALATRSCHRILAQERP